MYEPLYMREPNPTEPVNYTGSYTTASKEIVDTQIAIHQSAGKIIVNTTTMAPRTIMSTAKQSGQTEDVFVCIGCKSRKGDLPR